MHIPLGRGAEFDLIRTFLAGATESGGSASERIRVGPGDDCAVVAGEIAISVDMAVEGVHFRREWLEAEEIGYRAAAAALSDLAAVAATPIGILVAIALREEDLPEFAARVMEGARAAAAGCSAALLGGDVTRTTGPLVLDVVVVGNAPMPVLRLGARPGDSLWVTGELGAAAAAVSAWRQGKEPDAAARLAFALPSPRIAEAAWLARQQALHALIDLSDGLAGDVGHLAAASGARILLDAGAIPIHHSARSTAADLDGALHFALSGGDDYELCLAAAPGAIERCGDEFMQQFGLAITRVGTVLEGGGVALRGFDGRVTELAAGGFNHFEGTAP